MFTKIDRTDVDVVEKSFVEYKTKHPEEDNFLVNTFVVSYSYRYKMSGLTKQLSADDRTKAIALAPWGYSFELSDELSTDGIDSRKFDMSIVAGGRNDILLRLSMLSYIFDEFDINGSWLDVATNCGIIPILISKERAVSVSASDFAHVNIDKANLLKKICCDEKCDFKVADAFDHLQNTSADSVDFISALGIFYHLSNPIGLLELMHSACKNYILIDTIVHNFAFSGWIQTVSRHVKHPQLGHANDTRKLLELHPTYRGLIDALYQVGFESVVEIVPSERILSEYPNTIYHTRNRRMLLAKKY